MLDYGEQRDLNNEQKKYSLWVFMDARLDDGMSSIKFMDEDKDKVLKFIGEYAISPDVVSVEYFELKELKIGVAL
mgnify:FL=1